MRKILFVAAYAVLFLLAAGMTAFAGRLLVAVCSITSALIRYNPVVILAVACGAVVTLLCVSAAEIIAIIVGGVIDDETND